MKGAVCIILLTLLLGGCVSKEPKSPIEEKSTIQEVAVTTKEETTEEDEYADKNEQNEVIPPTKDDVFLKYAEIYKSEHRFNDLYIPSKCWLIGNESIVEIISINEMENVTVIDTASIERVEQSNIGAFATVSVFDKTGKSISIIVSSEELDALLTMIRK